MHLKSIKELKFIILANLVFLIVFIIFARNFSEAIRLWWAFFIVFYIPGYFIAEFAFSDWKSVFKSILAPFTGIGVTSLILYYLSLLGIKSINMYYSISVALILLLLILFKEKIEQYLVNITQTR